MEAEERKSRVSRSARIKGARDRWAWARRTFGWDHARTQAAWDEYVDAILADAAEATRLLQSIYAKLGRKPRVIRSKAEKGKARGHR